MSNLPTISILVLNYNGLTHLKDCFPSLTLLDYPVEQVELLLVDNASTDSSVEFIRENYPQTRIVQSNENIGFAAGNNLGARKAKGQYIIFLNNDMWVAPQFVRGLVSAVRSGPEVVSAGAKILNWDGSLFDFAGGAVHFSGNAFQIGMDKPYRADLFTEIKPLLFPCGGAMIIDRQIFLNVGGFDDDYFIYFEDVDLGWRLWLLGYKVVFAPEAIVRHRHHGTMNRFADYRRQVLYKRNALYTVMKNYSDENLGRILPTVLLGAISGVVDRTESNGFLNPEEFSINGIGQSNSPIPFNRHDFSTLIAIREVTGRLIQVMDKRRFVQSRRRRSDEEVAHFFLHPFRGWQDVDVQTQYALADAFGIQQIFGDVCRRVLVISSDILPYPGMPTVGSGLRAWGLGQGLKGSGHEVVFSSPRAAMAGRERIAPPEAMELSWKDSNLMDVVRRVEPDIVVVCNWPVLDLLPAEFLGVPVVLDQHGPHYLERSYQNCGNSEENTRRKLNALGKADFFTCAGHKQFAYFQRWLEQAGWTEQERLECAAVIPVSLSPELPEHHPADETTFVYGGVFLPWQDPSLGLSVLVETLERSHRGKLHIYGGKHPAISIDTGVFEALLERLKKSSYVVAMGMVPHEELLAHYSRAHVAMDVMHRNPERELAFTTRTVEYLWCGLPVIHHDYAELTDYIRRYQAGWIVNPEDHSGLMAVVDEILDHPEEVSRRGQNAQRLVRECFTWDKTITPLDTFIRHPRMRPHAPPNKEFLVRNARYLLSTALTVYRQSGMKTLWREGRAFIRRSTRLRR